MLWQELNPASADMENQPLSHVKKEVGAGMGRSDGTPVGSSVGTDVGTQVYIDGSVSQHGVPRSLSVAMLQPVTPESESAATSVGMSPQRLLE